MTTSYHKYWIYQPYARPSQSNVLSSHIQIIISYRSNTLSMKKLSLQGSLLFHNLSISFHFQFILGWFSIIFTKFKGNLRQSNKNINKWKSLMQFQFVKTQFHLAKHLQAERAIISHSISCSMVIYKYLIIISLKPKDPKKSKLCYVSIEQFF